MGVNYDSAMGFIHVGWSMAMQEILKVCEWGRLWQDKGVFNMWEGDLLTVQRDFGHVEMWSVAVPGGLKHVGEWSMGM